jgi:diphthine synthase
MLTFIGLGLYDERSISIAGRDALQAADYVAAEFYTSYLVDATISELETTHNITIDIRDREGVEQHPEDILTKAQSEDVAFLTAGDTMISTTHTDLRLRAIDRGIDTRIIHGVTAQTAASGLTGLQNYRFGKSVTLPFPYAHRADGVPTSVTDSIVANRKRGLHTIVYLDIKAEREEYLRASDAAAMLASDFQDVLAVVVARAGSPDPTVRADRLSELAENDFGDPLHLLVIPGELHHLEIEALDALADAPADLLDTTEPR